MGSENHLNTLGEDGTVVKVVGSEAVTRVVQSIRDVRSLHVRGDRLITGSYDTTVRVHSLGSPREQHVYTRHTGDVNCVSASFARIASGSDDHSIWIHDFSPQAEGRAFANRTWLVAALVVLGERLRTNPETPAMSTRDVCDEIMKSGLQPSFIGKTPRNTVSATLHGASRPPDNSTALVQAIPGSSPTLFRITPEGQAHIAKLQRDG